MRAAVMRDRRIVVDDVPEPVPANGQVLVRTLACGICGSDLHALHHADHMAEVAAECGVPQTMDPKRDVVMGHEFCAEVLDYGAGTRGDLVPGTRVCSVPIMMRGSEGMTIVPGIRVTFSIITKVTIPYHWCGRSKRLNFVEVTGCLPGNNSLSKLYFKEFI